MTATLDAALEQHTRGCECSPCATYRKRKLYRLQHDQGVRRMTDATKAREHLLWLSEQGVGRRTVAAGLGLSELTLVLIGGGRRQRIKRTTEAAILGFRPKQADLVPNCATVDATPTRLRVEALIALGYTRAFIATELGRNQGELDINERIYRRRALAVLELCIRIGDTPGPSRKAAVQARNKQWRPPMDYDEDLFYDPHWDGTEPERESAAAMTRHLEEYDFLMSCGYEIEAIAERLEVTVGYIQVMLRRRSMATCSADTLATR